MSAPLYIARHGETTWNLGGRFQGRRESGLTALGIRQAIALATALEQNEPRIEAIISSPLLRCMATARFTAERLNLALQTDERLVEIAHGPWEGRLKTDVAENDAARYTAWRTTPAAVRFPDGESLIDVAARWNAFARELDTTRPTLVVTHDVVVRVALLAARQRPLDDLWHVNAENAGYAEFEMSDAGLRLVKESVTAHLDGIQAQVETQAL